MDKKISKRILAYIIDVALASSMASICSSLIFDKEENFFTDPLQINYWNMLYYMGFFAYFLFFDFVKQGDTIGKAIVSITVVNCDNSPLSLKKRLFRSLIKILGLVFLPVTFLVFIFGNHYLLQDEFIKTVTVSEKTKTQ